MTADNAAAESAVTCGSGRDSGETLDKLLLADHIAPRERSDLALAMMFIASYPAIVLNAFR